MNLKALLEQNNSGIYKYESQSPDLIKVRFTNGVTTTTNHLTKLMDRLNWINEDTFKLPEGWRSFEKNGLTFFTDKEETKISTDW